VHGWCTVANSSYLTVAAVVHDVHGLRGSRGNSAGRGSWSPNGGRKPSGMGIFLSLLILSLKTCTTCTTCTTVVPQQFLCARCARCARFGFGRSTAAAGTRKVARFNGRSAAMMFAHVRLRPAQPIHLFILCAVIYQKQFRGRPRLVDD
jgi:hypothetical protein